MRKAFLSVIVDQRTIKENSNSFKFLKVLKIGIAKYTISKIERNNQLGKIVVTYNKELIQKRSQIKNGQNA